MTTASVQSWRSLLDDAYESVLFAILYAAFTPRQLRGYGKFSGADPNWNHERLKRALQQTA